MIKFKILIRMLNLNGITSNHKYEECILFLCERLLEKSWVLKSFKGFSCCYFMNFQNSAFIVFLKKGVVHSEVTVHGQKILTISLYINRQ